VVSFKRITLEQSRAQLIPQTYQFANRLGAQALEKATQSYTSPPAGGRGVNFEGVRLLEKNTLLGKFSCSLKIALDPEQCDTSLDFA